MRYRYRDNLKLVIKGISFDISEKQKIGVIGRTGSGKSTLTLGFLRILELAQKRIQDQDEFLKGEITLDGVNIENVGLQHLRRSCGMIPQDPVLFRGTIRTNIDPLNEYSVGQVAETLKKVKLWDTLLQKIDKEKSQIDDLDVISVKVDQNGENFSQGERQLICMVRVLIKKPKVLLMDEATASIDEKTDYFIQSMIKNEFNDTTVITIAHRLNTIIQYDKILVLSEGKMIDFDTPQSMLSNKQSYLWKLVSEQGAEFVNKMNFLANNKDQNLSLN